MGWNWRGNELEWSSDQIVILIVMTRLSRDHTSFYGRLSKQGVDAGQAGQ